MKIPRLHARKWLPPILLLIVLSGRFFGDIANHKLHGDENWYPRTAAVYFSLFALEGDLDARAWFSPSAWNQPMIGRYLMGATVWLKGGDDLVQRMASLPRWKWHRSKSWNLENGRGPSADFLIPLRLLMAGFGVAACLCLYFLGSMVLNRWVGVSAALLLGFNPLTAYCSRFAMLDAPLLFFMTLTPILLVFLLRSYRRQAYGRCLALSLGVGVVGALATGTKLNGALSLTAFGFLIICLVAEAIIERARTSGAKDLRIQVARLGGLLAIAAATSASLFVASQPNFHRDPIGGAEEMVWNRIHSNVNMQESRPEMAKLDTLAKKIISVAQKTLLPGGYTLLPELPISLELILFPVGLLLLLRREFAQWKQRHELGEIAVLLIWSFVTFAGITFWIPFEWDRYFLPLLPPTSLIVASGLCLSAEKLLPSVAHLGDDRTA